MTWQFGILTDRAGHVHLAAVVAGSAYRARDYIELLAPIGAAHPAELDLEHLVVLVHGQDIANLRRLVEQCIDNNRLRQQLTELIELVGTASTERGMGSLSTVGTARHQSEVVPTFLDSPGSATVDLLAPEASAGGGDQDGGDGLCVVCGQRTTRTMRPMGRIT